MGDESFEQFKEVHQSQLQQIPTLYWESLYEKLRDEVLSCYDVYTNGIKPIILSLRVRGVLSMNVPACVRYVCDINIVGLISVETRMPHSSNLGGGGYS